MPEEKTQESAADSTDAENSALKTVFEAGAGFIVMALVWGCAIAAVFNSETAKKFFGQALGILKDTTNLKRVKGYVDTVFGLVWPKLARGFLILGSLTIIGISLVVVLFIISLGGWFFDANLWSFFFIATSWVTLVVGMIWAAASIIIYWLMASLRLIDGEKQWGKEWQQALSRPFLAVAMAIVTVAVLVLALPGPFKNITVIAVVAGMTSLWLLARRLTGKQDDNLVSYTLRVVAVMAAWTGIMFACPTIDRWVDARAGQVSRAISIDTARANDVYQPYKVSIAGKILEGDDVSLSVGEIVMVKTVGEIEVKDGLGPCPDIYVFNANDGTDMSKKGKFPLKFMQMCGLESKPLLTEVETASPPPSKSTARALLSGYSPFLSPALTAESSKSEFYQELKAEDGWVNTGLIVYPEDRVVWGPFEDSTVFANDDTLEFMYCLGVKVGTDYVPCEKTGVPPVHGTAGQYFALTSVWSNKGNYPMLICYTGEKSVNVLLRLERNAFKSPKGRVS
ncbi:MAG: hypothetical protein A2663_02125 [Candidatus Buchananbacteria bacterium RIFCSPHIGHO2_01_FULL_46_12]|uniref:Uncharacterized protein n=1 Tax=Candidatus Buchananbacteria bacterium RIFCSPHIGHO2_01_FULL_46_12 TaxID=1797536 RepID=A0A1G1Y575_9BACT|nr:MAG: hypothetical protein A2663_02125 [Candidatus Buchananbacteria bacterium RIFCSPHIGHO2_01_FULL_46_12]